MTEFKSQKPYRSADYHLQILKDRGLIIESNDEILVKNNLRRIGYFRLSGYFGPLQSSKDKFKEGTKFSDILRIYNFDKDLRIMTSYAIKSIEIELKARVTDVMSAVYESDWYYSKDLFMTEKMIKSHVVVCEIEGSNIVQREKLIDINLYDALLKDINRSIKRNEDKEYIKKFKNSYGDNAIVPSWMMMECISFGTFSRLFALLKPSPEKKGIAKHFGVIGPDIFTSWVHGFVVLRNACAHHARIWNRSLDKDLSFPNKTSAMIVSVRDDENVRKFYGISSCLLASLKGINQDSYDNYKSNFYKLVEKHGIDLSAMGFPDELNQYDVWK